MKRLEAAVRELDGKVAALVLEDLPLTLQLGNHRSCYAASAGLASLARLTPLLDGTRLRGALEHWAIRVAATNQPGIFSNRKTLLCPGLNHTGLATALRRHTCFLRYADPSLFFGLLSLPGVGSETSLEHAAAATLRTLCDASPEQLRFPSKKRRHARLFKWAEVIAGDASLIRRFATDRLDGKVVVVDYASSNDVDDFRRRGVSVLVTLAPTLGSKTTIADLPTPVVEGLLTASATVSDATLNEDSFLNLLAELEWQAGITDLRAEEARVHRFAFVIHPLTVEHIHGHPLFTWTRFLPGWLVELAAAYVPPFQISTIRGGQSTYDGQRVEGYLYTMGATPREMLRHSERFTYKRLRAIAAKAERKDARIMGLGAFTSVVGDAGVTVARECGIAITSGNSLTVSVTLEAAKESLRKMGAGDLTRGRAMVVGATGSIGAVCSRLLAKFVQDVVLVAINPSRLIELKHEIENETPGARVAIATSTYDLLPLCDLVVTATSAFEQRVVNVARCKPGAVICDVARPHDISAAEAAVRPDVLVIDGGEVLIPGEIDIGFDIGLPPKVSYACLAETALLAMEGLFVDFTIGRDIEIGKVKQIHGLFEKHGFRLAGLRSFDQPVDEHMVAEKRRLAAELRANPDLLAQRMAEAESRLAAVPLAAKGVGPLHRRLSSLVTERLGPFLAVYLRRHMPQR